MLATWVGTTTKFRLESRSWVNIIEYIPCFTHSLNLVGQYAAECCPEAVRFFSIVENIYTFFFCFHSSLGSWGLSDSEPKLPLPKRLSDTRWSARADATLAHYNGYSVIMNVLGYIAEDNNVIYWWECTWFVFSKRAYCTKNILYPKWLLMVTNCSGERSFSEVKRIKSEIRATLDQDRLNNSSLCIEHDLLRGMDMEKIIHEFSILNVSQTYHLVWCWHIPMFTYLLVWCWHIPMFTYLLVWCWHIPMFTYLLVWCWHIPMFTYLLVWCWHIPMFTYLWYGADTSLCLHTFWYGADTSLCF